MRCKIKTAIIICCLVAAVMPACAPRVGFSGRYPHITFDPRQLITPQDAIIQSTLKTILANKNDVRTDFRRIQDWVAANVYYLSDPSIYWQLPAETLANHRGDCTDYSTLLCTMWRAYGVPAGDVYVAIGAGSDNTLHAFIIEKYLNGKWQVIEPQMGGFITSDLDAAETAQKYAITYLFNDMEYSGNSSWIYRKINGPDLGPAATPETAKKAPLPVVNSFKADPPNISLGESALLSWDVRGATYVGIDQGIGGVHAIDTVSVSPIDTTEYKLVALNSSGSVTVPLTIEVKPATATKTPPQPAPTVADSTHLPLQVSFTGWYAGSENVSMVSAEQQVTAAVDLKGGSAGQCILRIWRAINTGNDEVVAVSPFSYGGDAAVQQISFSPSYAIGEADTRGYWVDLAVDNQRVWSMPDNYPPRLTVIPKPDIHPLTVSFAGWYSGTDSVYTVKKDQAVVARITLTGTGEGLYTLYVRRDAEGLIDPPVQQVTFSYNGTSAMQELAFSPPYATGESSTIGYYLDLYQDTKFIWSLSGNYPPRLTVNR